MEIRRLIIENNRNREKTTEQRTREYAALVVIEKELAAKRQQAGTLVKNSTKGDPNKNKAKSRAAEKVGLSDKTAGKAADIVKEIDKATAAGDDAKAAELRHELNEGSVSAAHRKATGTNGQKSEQGTH